MSVIVAWWQGEVLQRQEGKNGGRYEKGWGSVQGTELVTRAQRMVRCRELHMRQSTCAYEEQEGPQRMRELAEIPSVINCKQGMSKGGWVGDNSYRSGFSSQRKRSCFGRNRGEFVFGTHF